MSIRHAKALGYYVVVSDGDPQAPGLREADAGVVDATVQAARE